MTTKLERRAAKKQRSREAKEAARELRERRRTRAYAESLDPPRGIVVCDECGMVQVNSNGHDLDDLLDPVSGAVLDWPDDERLAASCAGCPSLTATFHGPTYA